MLASGVAGTSLISSACATVGIPPASAAAKAVDAAKTTAV